MKLQVEHKPLMSCWATNIYTWNIIDQEILNPTCQDHELKWTVHC